MARLRGEELPGFPDVLQTWLPHQPWFLTPSGRWKLVRTGGIRLPTPEGDADPHLFLELHVFDVRGAEGEEQRISVPLALRSRPSALAGKNAFVGRVTHEELGEVWLYDGARDRAFLAAWLEMVRREQGSRNGRSRGESHGGFSQREPYTVRLRRSCQDTDRITRTLITPEGTPEADWGSRVVIDFLRRPESGSPEEYPLLEALAAAKARRVPRLLGVVWGSWEPGEDDAGGMAADASAAEGQEIVWEYGDLALIREGTLAAPNAESLAAEAAAAGEDFTEEAHGIGHALGDAHADFAAAFGAHPQTAFHAEAASEEALAALGEAWDAARESAELAEPEREGLDSRIVPLRSDLEAAGEPLMLHTVHGRLGLHSFRRPSKGEPWMVDESGGAREHALPLIDAAAMVASLTETAGKHDSFRVSAVVRAFLEGLAAGDADVVWTGSALFRAHTLVLLLELRTAGRLTQEHLGEACTVLFEEDGSA